MSTPNRTIFRENGVKTCAELMLSAIKTADIVRKCMEEYGVSRSAVEKWMQLARPQVELRRKELEEIRKRETEAIVIESTRNLHISREAAEARLWAIFNGNMQDFFTRNNNLINLKDLPRELAGLLSSVEVDELYHGAAGNRYWVGQTKKIKLIDPLRAFELLGKMNGWLKGEGGTTINNFMIGYGKEVPV